MFGQPHETAYFDCEWSMSWVKRAETWRVDGRVALADCLSRAQDATTLRLRRTSDSDLAQLLAVWWYNDCQDNRLQDGFWIPKISPNFGLRHKTRPFCGIFEMKWMPRPLNCWIQRSWSKKKSTVSCSPFCCILHPHGVAVPFLPTDKFCGQTRF